MNKFILKLFILSILICVIECHYKDNLNKLLFNQINDHEKVLESWNRLNNQTIDLDFLTIGLSSRLESLLEFTPNISSKCSQSLINLKNDAKQMKLWAIKALDSWGRPSGIFTHGTFSFLGDYDTCLENDNLQYCTVYLRPLLPTRRPYENINKKIEILNKYIDNKDKAISILAEKAQLLYYISLRIGICLPNNCTSNEINNLLQSVSNELELKSELKYCENNKMYDQKFDNYAIVAILLFSIVILFSLIGTIVDYNIKDKKFTNQKTKCILAFSIKQNFVNIFKKKVHHKEIECLNGIRFFILIWVILIHIFLWPNHHLFSNTFNVYKILDNLFLNGILNGFFSVDTFFLISGMLSTYIVFTGTKGIYKNFNLFLFIISRYLRLTPGVLYSEIGFFLLPYLGSGPFFTEIVRSEVDNCRHHWFANLVYLQTNILDEDSSSICNLPGWWLSVELKLSILSSIVVVCFFFRKKLAFLISFILIIFSIIYLIIFHYENELPFFQSAQIPQVEEFAFYSSKFSHSIFIHIGPYFIGLCLGYLLAKEEFKNLSKRIRMIGWILSSLTILLLIFGPPYFLPTGYSNSKYLNAFYASTSQTIWSLAVSWIIIACINNYGGLVNKFLCLKIFRPFSRIVYMSFLVHGQILILYNGTRSKLIALEDSSLYYLIIGHLFNSFLYGFIMTLLVESPTLNLIKILIKKSDDLNVSKKNYYENDKNLDENSNDLNNNFIDSKEEQIKLDDI